MGRTSHAKEHLIDAITDLMWERSYGMVTIDQICELAGVKKGSFYYFYKSKADLTLDALESYWTTIVQPKLDTVFSTSKPGLARLLDHADHVYSRTVELKEKNGKILACCLFTIGQEICNVEQELRDKIIDLLERHQRYFITAVRDASFDGEIKVDGIEETAHCLFNYYEGLFSRARITNDPEVMKGLKTGYMRILGIKLEHIPA